MADGKKKKRRRWNTTVDWERIRSSLEDAAIQGSDPVHNAPMPVLDDESRRALRVQADIIRARLQAVGSGVGDVNTALTECFNTAIEAMENPSISRRILGLRQAATALHDDEINQLTDQFVSQIKHIRYL